jgi:hypothetical protein
MKIFVILLCFIAAVLNGANPEKVLVLKKTDTDIRLDGIIESVWSQADSALGFFQARPFFGEEPSRKTVAKLLSTDEALSFLVICYEKGRDIQQTKGKLDDLGGDVISLMLDTYGDERTAYKFAVTASGVRADCRLLDDARNRDYSWDGIWFAESKVYEWGYIVEMKIPYKSIQYDRSLTAWGLDFDRWIPTKTEDLYWCPFEESEGQRVSKFGQLVFEDFRPQVQGLNLEIYPVAISKTTYLREGIYDFDPDIGLDIFYNPSPKLTFSLTANPDFAQIEADPFDFNISRYESYFSERRPFFTEGNEVFMPSGKLRNSGFYRPLEMFYSRRIGKKLPDGQEVPLILGSRAFGRINDWEYGGFVAMTGETDYVDEDDEAKTEPQAYFTSGRIKKQILGNSSIGILYVGKHTPDNTYGVIDVDGAFRTSSWQLAYQLAQSFEKSKSGFAGAAGFTMVKSNWLTYVRGRFIDNKFDNNQVGFVPWIGTKELVGLSGPRWYFDSGDVQQILIYTGPIVYYESADRYTDLGWLAGYNMQFRNNWGFEINIDASRSKDSDVTYNSFNFSFSSWFNTSPIWHASVGGGFSRNYNFSREYLAYYSWAWGEVDWQVMDEFEIGTLVNMYVEWDPDNNIEDITYNARPYFSYTPINDLNVRLYVDNVFVRSSDQLEQAIIGFLIAYNFSPKSWFYLALNEIRARDDNRIMRISDRVGVMKVSYLYYF